MKDIAKPLILCIPEVRPEFGYGHLTRQCILVNYLREYERKAILVIPDAMANDDFYKSWMEPLIDSKYCIASSVICKLIAKGSPLRRIVIDSYDLIHTAKTIGIEINSNFITVIDDLAYERDYSDEINPIIPNICSIEQISLIKRARIYGQPAYSYGKDLVLVAPIFKLTPFERKKQLKLRLERLEAIHNGKGRLIILMGFGGSFAALNNEVVQEKVLSILNAFKLLKVSVEVRCIGKTAKSICSEIKHNSHYLGWLDARALRQAYDESDIYVGAIGYSMWERAMCLLPSFVVPISTNQLPYSHTGQELGIHRQVEINSQISLIEDVRDMLHAAASFECSCDGFLKIFT